MRVEADVDLCQGHAMCELDAPSVFTVPMHGKVQILQESPSDELRPEVERAVKFCPTHALRVIEALDRTEGDS